jgi:antitoxin component YwqK of YwqJK toxin-antitoxin module
MSRTRRVLAVACGVVLGGAAIGVGLLHHTVALAQPAAVALDKTATEPAGPKADPDKPKAEPDAAALAADEAAVAAHIKALSDPNSDKRAAAAEALRQIVARYPSGTVNLRAQDGGEAEWRKKIAEITPDMSLAEIRKILPRLPAATGEGSTPNGDAFYQLDFQWMVTLEEDQSGYGGKRGAKTTFRPVLEKSTFQVDVTPPKDFTGTWTTWYVNGQKAFETQYKHGAYDGVLTSYHDNGGKSFEQHYTNNIGNGADTGWYPDGKLMYTAQYRDDKQDGTWTDWYANGIKRRETTYDNGKINGRQTSWYESGKVHLLNDYLQGVKHGVEASWQEDGTLDYKRSFVNGKIVD